MEKHTYPNLTAVDFYAESGNRLSGTSAMELRWRVRDPRIKIGRGTYGRPTIVIYSSQDRVEIGNFTSIAGGSYLLAGGEHPYEETSTFPFRVYYGEDPGALAVDPAQVRYLDAAYKGPLRIGSDVWIGYRAMICSGVSVGHGSVIGAGAVVAKDVPPYSIVVGNPAKVIKSRFDDSVISKLLEIRWWDWDPYWINHYRHELVNKPLDFIAIIESIDVNERKTYFGLDPDDDQVELEAMDEAKIDRKPNIKTLVRDLTPPIVHRAMVRLKTASSSLLAKR